METDQNINPEGQDGEIKETHTGEQIQEGQEDSVEKKEEIKEITPEEKIKELEDKLLELSLKWKIKEEDLKKKKMMLLIMVDFLLQKRL